MEHKIYLYLFIATLIILALLAYYFLQIIPGRKYSERTIQLKNEYDDCLKSGDKKAALQKGREYYSHLRNGDLSIYDEQAIQNDLSTMEN